MARVSVHRCGGFISTKTILLFVGPHLLAIKGAGFFILLIINDYCFKIKMGLEAEHSLNTNSIGVHPSGPLTWKAQDFIFKGEAPHLKNWLLPKNNKIDLFQVRGEAQCFPSEGRTH